MLPRMAVAGRASPELPPVHPTPTFAIARARQGVPSRVRAPHRGAASHPDRMASFADCALTPPPPGRDSADDCLSALVHRDVLDTDSLLS